MMQLKNRVHTQNTSPLLLAAGKSTAFFKPVTGSSLTINQPNDRYEQEANGIADRAMQLPVNGTASFFTSSPAVQRKCAHCEEEEIYRKTAGGISDSVTAPQVVHDVISTAGQPMDTGLRHFMESRLNYDFTNVRVHNDQEAHRSSAAINALAYTHGNHIVFGAGQYQPATHKGKRLLAHELTHVVQQKAGCGIMPGNAVQRKIMYGATNDQSKDPIDLVLQGPKAGYIALTSMTINGHPASLDAIIEAFDASHLVFTQNTTTHQTEVSNSNISLNISADRILWSPPKKNADWGKYYDRTQVPGSKANCSGGNQLYVELKGKPDSASFCSWVNNNEDEHVKDLKTAGKSLEVYYDRINKRTLPPCASTANCAATYNQQFKAKDRGIAAQFIRVWDSLVQGHDNDKTGAHQAEPKYLKNECDRAVIEIGPKFK